MALLRAKTAVAKLSSDSPDVAAGIKIVLLSRPRCVRSSSRRRCRGSVVVGKILENDNIDYGFDAQNEEYGNMIERGIII